MKKRMFLVTLGIVGLLVAGGLLASNMGFKLNYALQGVAPTISRSGTSTLGLPFHQQTNLEDAYDLILDLNAAGPGTVVSVARYITSTDGLEIYYGTSGTAFPLAPGEGYLVKVNGTIDYIVVGSHNPVAIITFPGTAAGSRTGTTLYAPPYHTTLANAFGLIGELNAAGPGTVVSVARYIKSTDGLEIYYGTSGTAFPLVPGEAYYVKVDGTINLTPSHY